MLPDSYSTLVGPGGFSSLVEHAIHDLLPKAFSRHFPQVWPIFSEEQDFCFLELAALLW